MKSNRTKWLISATLVIWLYGLVFAQGNPSDSTEKLQSAVTVPFLVDDGHGNAMPEVSPSDLLILDDKKAPQRVVTVHTAKDMPLRLGLLIDTSASQVHSQLYAPEVKSAFDFLKQVQIRADDKVFILDFSANLNGTDFMDKEEFLKSKTQLVSGGGTALYDAIHSACIARMRTDLAKPARRVLLLLSDGDDNLSHKSREETVAAAQNTGTVIFTLSSSDGTRSDKGRRILERLASATGGISFLAFDQKDLPKIFAEIQANIEHMYGVTYVASDADQSGRFHSLELKIASDKKWKVHAPAGYVPTMQ